MALAASLTARGLIVSAKNPITTYTFACVLTPLPEEYTGQPPHRGAIKIYSYLTVHASFEMLAVRRERMKASALTRSTLAEL